VSHRYQPGDTILYAGIPVTIAYVALLERPADPTQPPGYFYALRTAEMARDLYLLLPAREVEFAADYHERMVA